MPLFFLFFPGNVRPHRRNSGSPARPGNSTSLRFEARSNEPPSFSFFSGGAADFANPRKPPSSLLRQSIPRSLPPFFFLALSRKMNVYGRQAFVSLFLLFSCGINKSADSHFPFVFLFSIERRRADARATNRRGPPFYRLDLKGRSRVSPFWQQIYGREGDQPSPGVSPPPPFFLHGALKQGRQTRFFFSELAVSQRGRDQHGSCVPLFFPPFPYSGPAKESRGALFFFFPCPAVPEELTVAARAPFFSLHPIAGGEEGRRSRVPSFPKLSI